MPGEIPRRATVPPVPPSPPRDLEQRVWVLEHVQGRLIDDVDELVKENKEQTTLLRDLATAYEQSRSRRNWWMKFALTVLSGLTLAGFTWIATILNATQHAKLSP